MVNFLQFAILGMGAASVFALLSQGLLLVYRASGILNFAQSAIAMVGAYVFVELHTTHGLPTVASALLAVLVCAIVGALCYVLVMRPLRHAAPLTRVIGTLGIMSILMALANIRWGALTEVTTSYLPDKIWHIGRINVPEDRVILLGIAALITAFLYVGSRYTTFGLATLAMSENEAAAACLGWSPDRIAIISWTLSGAVGGLAGTLIVPLAGLSVSTLTLLIVPALAAALIAQFSSFPVMLIGAICVGVIESELSNYVRTPGFAEAVPFLIVTSILVGTGKSLPLRSHVTDRLPRLGSGIVRPTVLLPTAAAATIGILFLPLDWSSAIGISLTAAVLYLSIVVVTGYAGQLSLAQLVMAGIGALVAARLVQGQHWPFELAMVAAMAVAGLVGILVGIPALRARGINLAIVTLGLGAAISYVIFGNAKYWGGALGTTVGPQTFFGISLDALDRPRTYALFCLGWFIVASLAVCNLRRGRAGRRLIAIRTNERAAASLGINVMSAKLYAFAIASVLAGLAGILIAFQANTITYGQFDVLGSLVAVVNSMVGGIGYVIGPIFGSTLAQGGFPGGLITSAVGAQTDWLSLIGGVLLVIVLLLNPNGIADSNVETIRSLRARLRRRSPERIPPGLLEADAPSDELEIHSRSSSLEVRDLTVRFGGTTAVDKLSLTVRSGEVIGLIGPNGAGKSTLIDAVTGFAKAASGEIVLDDQRIDRWSAHRRSRAGVTRSFQSLELFDDLTVLANLQAASDSRDLLAYVSGFIRPGRPRLSPAARLAVKEFGLEEDLLRRCEELPYGRRRLVAIARAVATHPKILLLDEPAASLDGAETAELGDLVRRLAKQWGIGVLLVEHDMSIIMSSCDRLVVLNFGQKIADGDTDSVRADQGVIDAYLGGAEMEQGSDLVG